MGKFAWIVVLALAVPAAAFGQLAEPTLAATESGTQRISFIESGQDLYEMSWTLTRQADGRTLYSLKGNNLKDGAERITWTEEGVLAPINGHLRTMSWKKRSDGAEQMDWELRYDWQGGGAVYKFTDRAAGKTETKSITLGPDTLPGDQMNILFRGFPFEKGAGARIEGSFVMTDGMVIKGAVEMVGEETLDTPMGKIPCYKLQLKPKGLVGVVAPDMFLWFAKKPPHVWVRYDGRDEGLMQARTRNLLLKYQPTEALTAP